MERIPLSKTQLSQFDVLSVHRIITCRILSFAFCPPCTDSLNHDSGMPDTSSTDCSLSDYAMFPSSISTGLRRKCFTSVGGHDPSCVCMCPALLKSLLSNVVSHAVHPAGKSRRSLLNTSSWAVRDRLKDADAEVNQTETFSSLPLSACLPSVS